MLQIITPFQYFLVNLVASDFVMIALGAPWDLLAIWQNGWKLGKTPCLIVGFIKMFCGCTSLLTLTVLSVQRCLYVWSPAFFSIRGYRLPKYLIVFIWSLSASFSVPPFFGWSEYVPEQCGLSCAPCFQDPRYKDYSIYILVAGFIIPLIVIITSSALTILRLRFYAQLKAKANLKSDLISRREWKATLMVLVMVLVFFLSWSGYSTICLLRIFGVDYPDISVAISMMTAKSSAWTNCLIYIGMNSRIRRYVLPDWCLIFSDPDDDSSMEEKAVTHQREEDDGEAEEDNEDGKIPKFNQIAPDNIDFEIDGGICKLSNTSIIEITTNIPAIGRYRTYPR